MAIRGVSAMAASVPGYADDQSSCANDRRMDSGRYGEAAGECQGNAGDYGKRANAERSVVAILGIVDTVHVRHG